MPTLRSFFAIYTDGARLNDAFEVPPGADVFLGEMSELVVPGAQDELFGPHVPLLQRFKPKRGFLLGVTKEVKGKAGTFFDDARKVVTQATKGVPGVGLDVLRLWPFPLVGIEDALPEETLAEDLFSVGFNEMGEHGFRAETFGLAKLGQREVSFEFRGRELIEEAALMCGHLADWLMDHGRRIEHAQSMAFGFDRVSFLAAEGANAGGPFRGWHPPLIQRVLPERLFPGVGVLEIVAQPEGTDQQSGELTVVLQRSLEQRLLLEELDLTGDSPHSMTTARVNGFIKDLADLVVWREEHAESKDSGWRFRSTVGSDQPNAWGVMPLTEIARKMPSIIRYLALPWGVRLEWNSAGKLAIDVSKTHHDDDDAADLED